MTGSHLMHVDQCSWTCMKLSASAPGLGSPSPDCTWKTSDWTATRCPASGLQSGRLYLRCSYV